MQEACACMGPRSGEPYCMCQMIHLGLKKQADYEMTEDVKRKLDDELRKIFSINK